MPLDRVQELEEYNHRDYSGYTARLDLNECPFEPPEHIVRRACREVRHINRYPDGSLISRLRELVSEYNNVQTDNVVLAAGSDDLIRSLLSMLSEGSLIVVPKYSFVVYHYYAQAYGLRTEKIDMRPEGEGWVIDKEELLNAARGADVIAIDNPNNPTGSPLLDARDIEELVGSTKALVMVDEAYYEFYGETVVSLAGEYGNLLVLRTFSKAFCLPGARMGYAIAPKKWAAILRKIIPPFPVSRPSLAAAIAALENRGYVRDIVEYIKQERERLRREIAGMGLKPYRSETNFILVQTSHDNIVSKLSGRGVAVAPTTIGPEWFRASVGSRSENDALLRALSETSIPSDP